MNAAEALRVVEGYVPTADASGPCEREQLALQALAALLRRDWAVRVLDAWAQTQSGVPSPRKLINGKWGCLDSVGSTPDAARLAAAEAVWPELPESVRAELGERP